ncbi:uncharacterized protein MONOS_6745 [Monocercomonoides exilis]|uniref:uncharacterized protein n=1 Tax=Monocercomonoides exilis TaxID=2049356 RepID=UPI00355974AD|nr:hypothetical protein MONOS_6745 [Monocercomonoides exilis]|eukprot:MONOS_6745.1-p1 / transcript=MONOS_6745.1 / gene=MONOS_6745 / organism=Monocercomonoides_exilis_PA203 / gene_product=unspecified product / transcript_product=unspecified product / location=Mono_scaffold00218:43938-46674(+) / protein_length=894 / sequence_SO=supercontig / SO=protein_coding / is_pseudo=false
MIFSLILAEFSIIFCDLCDLDNNTLHTIAEVKTCLNSIPKEEAYEDIKRAKMILNNYIFSDQHLNPPEPHKNTKINLAQSLDDIPKDNLESMDIYMQVVNTLKALKDPHTLFFPPCYRNFRYVLPYSFTAQIPAGEGAPLRIIAIKHSYENVTKNFIDSGKPNLENKEITRIGLEGENSLKDASEVISNFAENEVPYSKYPVARLNEALKSAFAIRNAAVYDIPKAENIWVEYDDDGEKKVIAFPWKVVVGQSMNGLDSICPKIAETNSDNESRRSDKAKIENDESSKSFSFSELREREMKKFLDFLYESEEIGAKTMREANEKFREMQMTKLQTNNASGNSINKRKENDFLLPTDALEVFVDDPNVVVGYSSAHKVGYVRIISFNPDDVKQFGQILGDGIKDLVEKYKAERCVIDVRGNGGGAVLLGMQLNQFLHPSTYPWFGQYRLVHSKLNEELSKVPDDDGQVLYIDPHTRKQFKGRTWYTNTDTLKFRDTTHIPESEYNRDYTPKYEMDMSDPPVFLETIKNWPNYPGHKKMPIFTPSNLLIVTDGLCGSTCACFVKRQQEAHAAKFVGLGSNPHVAQKDYDVSAFPGGAVFSLDGIESTVKQAKNHPEWGVNIDMKDYNFQRKTTDISWTMHGIYTWEEEKKKTEEANDGEDIQTGKDLLEFKLNKVDTTLNMFPQPLYDRTNEGVTELIEKVVPIFNQCFDWEVQVDTEKCTGPKQLERRAEFSKKQNTGNHLSSSRRTAFETVNGSEPARVSAEHKLYGHPCVGGKFVQEKCVFAGCEAGFYLDGPFGDGEESECLRVPDFVPKKDNPDEEKLKKEKVLYMSLIGGMFGVFVIILAVVSVVVVIKKKSGKKMVVVEEQSPLYFEDDYNTKKSGSGAGYQAEQAMSK